MNLGPPQLIFLFLMVLEVGFILAKHDEPRTGKHNFGWALVIFSINISLLWWGGFFHKP